MLAYVTRSQSGPASLEKITLPEPKPGKGEVLIGMRAVSLNYRDLVVAEAILGGERPDGLIPVSDGAGEVVAVGEGVTRFKQGDRVVASFMRDWIEGPLTDAKQATSLGGGGVNGLLAERVVLPESSLLPIPSHLNYEEASTLPCAALTAWNAMFEHGNLRAGQTLLVLGTGGVSIFALQFGKMIGANVIVTSSSDEKLAHVREMGAWHTINYRKNPDWHEDVLAATGGVGVDMTIEVGGPGTINNTLKSTRYGGTVALMGVLTGAAATVETVWILHKNIRVQGIYVGSIEMFERMNNAISASRVRPVIDRVFDFDEAVAAYDFLRSKGHFGKIVIKVTG